MPLWRKLFTALSEDTALQDMPDDLTRLLWVMLPIALDCHGRGIDRPSWVCSKVFPLRDDVTDQQVAAALDWFGAHGLIERYRVDDWGYFQMRGWAELQGDCSREAPSRLPPPPSAAPTPSARARSRGRPGPHTGRSRTAPEQVKTRSRATHALDSDSESDSEQDSDSESDNIMLPATRADAAATGTQRRSPKQHAPSKQRTPCQEREPCQKREARKERKPPSRREKRGECGPNKPRVPPRTRAAPPPGPSPRELADELAGVLSPAIAVKLAERYPERVKSQLAHYRWAQQRGRARGPGWLVRAIEEDWPLPTEVWHIVAADDPWMYVRGKYAAYIQY